MNQSHCTCGWLLAECAYCDRRPPTRLELLAAEAGVTPEALRTYLRLEIAYRRPSRKRAAT